jgi:NTE family protein
MADTRRIGNKTKEKTVLVLQGGGALGSYQAGVYEALAAEGHSPDWIAGISIGAINAALIAGNPPERRVERLREFWETVSSWLLAKPAFRGEEARALFNEASAGLVATFGLPGFFQPRLLPALAHPPGTPGAISIYETHPLRRTLENLVDFDLLNSGRIRVSVGAVNLGTGNFAYFDTAHDPAKPIGPEHIMASGALPPGFSPVEIDGEYYWDGGLVSNTPLSYVLDEQPRPDMMIFQVDLFSARGMLPRTLPDVYEREKDIKYSSRTRLNTDLFKQRQELRRAARRLLEKLPDSFADDPDAKLLREFSCDAAITILHLIHRRKNHFTQSKDYEFSRHSMEEHWDSGLQDVQLSFSQPAWRDRETPKDGVTVLDLTRELEP